MTDSDVIEDYKRAYSDFFREVQPIVSRGSAGGVVVRPVHREPFRMRIWEMRMMTRLYLELMKQAKALERLSRKQSAALGEHLVQRAEA